MASAEKEVGHDARNFGEEHIITILKETQGATARRSRAY
jgi:hypothetical protein